MLSIEEFLLFYWLVMKRFHFKYCHLVGLKSITSECAFRRNDEYLVISENLKPGIVIEGLSKHV